MEICETSSLPIPMLPRLHQSNGYIKRKLRARRVQKCIGLVGADTVLTTAWMQSTQLMWGIDPRIQICGNSGLHIPMVPRFHQSNGYRKRKLRAWRVQSNGYVKRKLRAWRVPKCIAQIGTDTVLTTAGKQSTPFHGGLYRAKNGNMRDFGPINPHGTAFAPKQCLYEKESTGMESSKLYRPSRCRYRTYHCVEAKYPVSWGVVEGPEWKY